MAVLTFQPGSDLQKILEDYRKDSSVESAEINGTYSIQLTPKDARFSELWAMPKIEAPAAWDVSRGKGVIVAVVDTGIDHNHKYPPTVLTTTVMVLLMTSEAGTLWRETITHLMGIGTAHTFLVRLRPLVTIGRA
jgi:hypothetical protein